MLKKSFWVALLVAGHAGYAAAAEGPLRLSINLPSYELEVWDGDEKIRTYTATIGAEAFPTPTGGFQITRIEWNPSWTPPPSKWARGKKPVGPGPNNPMGRVKMQFDDYLYVHGTSRTSELGGAHSHGCIRLSNADALDLARLLATRSGVLTDAEVDALQSGRRTRSVRLPAPIPIRIRYGLQDEVSGNVVEYDDPYRWRESARVAPGGAPLAMLGAAEGAGGRRSRSAAEGRA